MIGNLILIVGGIFLLLIVGIPCAILFGQIFLLKTLGDWIFVTFWLIVMLVMIYSMNRSWPKKKE